MHIHSFAIIHPLSLLHSDAASFNPDIHNMRRAGYAYNCSGSESRLADCRRHHTENCNTRIGVQCYNVTSNTTVSLSTSCTTVRPSSSTMVSPRIGPSRLRLFSPSIYVQATPTAQLVTPSPLLQATTPTKSLFPIYIYATIGIVTVLVLSIVGIVIVAIIMCRISARRKQLTSPQFTQNNDYVPKEESLYSNSKDHTMVEPSNEITQHHIYHEVAPPAVHTYEDVKPNKQNEKGCEQGGDYASLDRSTHHHNSDSTSNRETTMEQHSYSCLNHKKPPPEKGKPYVPHAVNQLSFLMSPTKTNFADSTNNTFPSDSNNPPTTAASNGVYGEQCGNHVYAILEDPSKCHTQSTSAVHYSTQGEVVGGHQYAILEAPTILSHRAMHSDTGSTTSSQPSHFPD